MRKMMKKDILIFGSLLSLMSVSGAALAQNCTSPTRCGELGYTMSKEDCADVGSLVCPFDDSKYFCLGVGTGTSVPGSEAQPGMILYSDGTASNDVFIGKAAIGIVAYTEEGKRFAIALEEKNLTWSGSINRFEDLLCIPNYDYDNISSAQTDFNGAANTSCIVNYESPYDKDPDNPYTYPAAEYCNSYKPVSKGLGYIGWYLPAAGELHVLKDNYAAINLSLQKLAKTQLSASGGYWSSSEGDSGIYAWVGRPSNGDLYYVTYGEKNDSNRARCVLAF